jgi:hypothetical protein
MAALHLRKRQNFRSRRFAQAAPYLSLAVELQDRLNGVARHPVADHDAITIGLQVHKLASRVFSEALPPIRCERSAATQRRSPAAPAFQGAVCQSRGVFLFGNGGSLLVIACIRSFVVPLQGVGERPDD